MRDERLAAAYASADVFVFPSLTDTFGLVLLEALTSPRSKFTERLQLRLPLVPDDIDQAAILAKVMAPPGLVVLGDLIGAGAAQEQAVVGETPNLAARLQALAEPNTVVIAEGTRIYSASCSDWRTSAPRSSKAFSAR